MYATTITTIRRVNGFLSRLMTDTYLFESYNDALAAYNLEIEYSPDPMDGVSREVSIVLLPDDLTDTTPPVTLTVAR